MITRYFVVAPAHCEGFKAVIVPNNDNLPLDQIPNSKQLATLADGRVILHVVLSLSMIKDLQEITGIADPLSIEAVTALGLGNTYIGPTRQDVLDMFPELDGTRTITLEDCTAIEEPILPLHEWR